MKSLGYQIKTLKRTKISNLELGSLKLGTFRELTEKEKNKIF
jgi:23S rRNA pseudouridine2604 synthase